jgi:multiple sugar transport system ATP-binding protein
LAEILLDQVRKIYPDGTEAVHYVDLEVPDGNLMVLVGPSGCGKTTLLRMVAGLEEITEGTVQIGGRIVNEVTPKDRDIAMIFQNYALYPHMSVYDNQAFGLKLRKLKRGEIQRRVEKTADVLGLMAQLKKKPGQLSGGQRQRVAMGRAIVREPQAFLMDEPLSNLDAKLRVQMRTEISRLQRDLGVTTIYVTHDQTEAMTMGDQVAVLKLGVLQQVDAPQALYDTPANLFVAGFIGSPAMNLTEATLVRSNGSTSVDFGGLRLRVDDETVAARPALKRYEDRKVVLGIRPESMEDASIVREAPEDHRIAVFVEVREAMGPETFAHFTVDAPPVVTEDTKELAADSEALDLLTEEAEAQKSRFVARLNAQTKAREGERVELVVDTGALHFFDPETGQGIYSEDS